MPERRHAPGPLQTNGVSIRSSIAADMPAVLKIYTQEVLHGLATFEEVPPTLAEMVLRRQAILDLNLPYLVAEQKELVVGYSYVSSYRPRPAYQNSVENSVYVSKDIRGTGARATFNCDSC